MSFKTLQIKPLASLVAATLALTAAANVHAADADLGALSPLSSTFQIGFDAPLTTFLDTLDFSLATDSIASFSTTGQGFSIPGLLTLSGSPDVSFAIYKGGEALTDWGTSFTGLSLSAGSDYAFLVKGGTGGYTVTWSVTPVPEPGTMALVLAGVGAAGLLS